MTKYLKIAFISLTLIILASFSVFAEITFQASIDKSELKENEKAILTVKISGGDPSDPEIEESPDYEIRSVGSSSEMQIINGNITSSISYSYAITPKKTGKITIKHLIFEIESKKYSTDYIDLKVLKDETKADKNLTKKNNMVFITAEVDNKKPYVNEPITYTFRFYRKVQVGNNKVNLPEFKDFWVEDYPNTTGKQLEYEKFIDNDKYVITEVKKYLFPSKSGEIIIPSAFFAVEVLYQDQDDFGFGLFSSTKTKVEKLKTEPIIIKVADLPSNKPKNFSNIVGKNISFEAIVMQNSNNVGDSISLDFRLKGKGNVFDFSKLEIPESTSYKFYKDKPVQKLLEENNQRVAQKDIKFSIVPAQKGKITIPSMKISYFDTNEKNFKELSSKIVNLNITGDEEKIDSKTTISNEKTDLVKIKTKFDITENLSFSKKFLYTFMFFLPPLFPIFFLNKDKFKKNNKEKQNNTLLSKITELEKKENLTKDDLNDLYNLVLSYFETKTNLKINDLSLDNYKNLSTFIEKFEEIKFSGSTLNSMTKQNLFELANKIIKNPEG